MKSIILNISPGSVTYTVAEYVMRISHDQFVVNHFVLSIKKDNPARVRD